MRKFLHLAILIFFFFIGIKEANATYILGVDMQWASLGNDTFEIKLTVYRRCTDGAASFSPFPPTITSDSCANAYSVTVGELMEYVIDDITPVCNSYQKICPSAGGNGMSTPQIPFGVERHMMRYKIYLGGSYTNCCWYKLRWQACCRNSNITTGYADANFITEAWLNHCVSPYDNSPDFKNSPIAIKCAGQDVCYNPGAFDADGDSLSFAMAPPLGGSYSSPWSYTYPLTCLFGNNQNPNANPPTGFNLDPRTCDFCFRPMQVQNTVLKVMVTEWRKNSIGVYKVIGKNARDMQFAIVQNCNNKLPSQSGPYSYEACAGQEICITINTNDQDLTDTTNINWNQGIPNASWTSNNGQVKRASGTICWTPHDSDASSLPRYFTATTTDTHCPLNGTIIRSYSITVKAVPKTNRKFLKLKDGKFLISITKDSTSKTWISSIKVYTPYRVGTKPIGTLISTVQNQEFLSLTYQFPDTGKYVIRSTAFGSGCTNSYLDTIDLRKLRTANMVTGKVYLANDANCVQQDGEINFRNIQVNTSPAFNSTFTDSAGRFTLYLDTGFYLIKTGFPNYLSPLKTKNYCPASGAYSIKFDTLNNDTGGFVFAQELVKVPILSIDFLQTGLRPCVPHPGFLYYSNIGTKDTFNVKISLILPPNIIFISSTKSCIKKGDTLIFTIDTLKAGSFDTIEVWTNVDCKGGLVRKIRCFKFGISPDNKRYNNLTTNANYDRSVIRTKAECLDSTHLKFTIFNDGESMLDENEYRIFENSKLCFKGKFKLTSNDKKEFIIKSANSTYRLEANQNFYYPTYSNPCSIIRSCRGANSSDTNNINDLPQYYEGFTYKEKCFVIVDGYDPNQITVTPSGVGDLKIVKRNEPLHYRIDFQNTGNAAAFNIVVVDTLSELLDFSTFEIDMSSHKYTTEIIGNDKKIIKFIFKNINLIDSTTDEKNSHGFITYTIKPINTIVSGSKINSRVFIYFDFNDPVETNTAHVSIHDSLPYASNYPITIYAVPKFKLDSLPDICVDAASFNLNTKTNLNPDYSKPTEGNWFINGNLLIGNIFNPALFASLKGDSVPLKINAKYVYHGLGSWVSDSVVFNIYSLPIATIKVPKFQYSECDTNKQKLDITGTMPINKNSKSRFFIDGVEINSTGLFIPSSYKIGKHLVRHEFANSVGCKSSATDSFFILPKPVVTILPIKNLCEKVAMNPDSGFAIEATINAPYKGHWINYSGKFIRGTNELDEKAFYSPSETELANGLISLEWESIAIPGLNQCKNANAKAIALIYKTPVVTISANDTIGSYPLNSKFIITIKNSNQKLQYNWNFGDPGSGVNNISNVINPNHTFTLPGLYQVKCIVKNTIDDCFYFQEKQFTIRVLDIAKPWIVIGPDSLYTFTSSNTLKLRGLNLNPNVQISDWRWWWNEPVNYNQPQAIQQEAEYSYGSDTGWHTITLQLKTTEGCVSEVTKRIRIEPDISVFIPNAFSPDNNGPVPNEKFTVNAEGINSFQISVYNRWGEKLYESNNYTTHGWDGSFDNQAVPEDIYICKIIVTGFNGKRYEYNETIHLIR